MPPLNKESTIERRVSILNKLDIDGQVIVADLSKELEVSEVTIRNDLKKLEGKKMLVRTRGGLLRLTGLESMLIFPTRTNGILKKKRELEKRQLR